MRARVPASSANLGPGFDVLAVALALHVTVEVTPADSFSLTTTGEGAGRFDDERHLAAVVAREVLGHDRFALAVHSEIPVSRGLGSSASLALAAAAAAGDPDALTRAASLDGHAENAAASALGGLVAATVRAGEVVARPLALDPRWHFVVVVPDEELATAAARAVLPAQVPFADAVANLTSLALLGAGLADADAYAAGSMADRLHQPYRAALLPWAGDLLATLVESGASDACWSGAGSTMLALVREELVDQVRAAAESWLEATGRPGRVLALACDHDGLTLT